MGSQTRPPAVAPEIRRVFDSLRWIVRALRLAPGTGGAGLSAAQQFVLHVLAERGALSVGELAEGTATDPSSVSVVVRKLHEKGLVEKRPSAEDRRRLEVSLTREGAKAARRGTVPVQEVLMGRMAALRPEELAQLADLLARVAPVAGEAQAAPMFFHEEPAEGGTA